VPEVYDFTKQVAKGHKYNVFRAVRLADLEVFACKMTPEVDKAETELVVKEITLMKLYQSSNFLVRFHEAAKYRNFLFIVVDYMDCGSIKNSLL
jgi:serine/threonine protein kinase